MEKKRSHSYLVVTFALLVGGALLNDIDWQGSVNFHTLMESLATLLALFVGTMALIRYFSQRDDLFLYIGAGFIGTAFLDAYHAIVTSAFFLPYMPTDYPNLTPWSWIASRLFLASFMFLSWLLWYLHRHDNKYLHSYKQVFWWTGLATITCFLLFSIAPLPRFTTDGYWIHRPLELIPALLFLLALIGYLHKGAWKDNDFEHWLVLSLIVGLATQSVFMPFSLSVNDTEFNLAHLLKKVSYVLVLTGLLISLYQTYKSLQQETRRRIEIEEELRLDAVALAKSEQWFRAVADYTFDWETWISPSGEMLYNSPACESVTGYPASDFLSGNIGVQDILSPRERIGVARHFTEIGDHEAEVMDIRIINKAGEERWINHACQPIFDKDGKFLGRRANNRDITDRKLADIENQTLLTALQSAPLSVVITDAGGRIEYVNPKFVEVTGYPKSEVLGKNPRVLKSGEHNAEFYQHLWGTLTSGASWAGEIRNKRRDGSLYWESVSISPILDGDGNIRKYVAVKQEITEKKQLEEILHQKANFDALTGLPNRTLFEDRLALALKKVARNTNNLALIMLDLDHFKEVNDTLGHDAGDELLRQAAARMKLCVRDTDTVARIGGDEFAILLESITDQTPQEITQRLLTELGKPFLILGKNCQISGSIGIAFPKPDNANIESLKKEADIALYQAKHNGRNCAVFFRE
ncbi:MAG: diguanylate cyclase [Sideroxydans sp.]|jgi:diguanylate cyclase (GGDEF)-like protein/PAS domain S-box-containing protein